MELSCIQGYQEHLYEITFKEVSVRLSLLTLKENKMNKLTRWTSIATMICVLNVSWLSAGWAMEDAIIAVVNNELITLKDLKDYVHSTYVSLVAEGMSDADIKKTMAGLELNGTIQLIEDKLILSKAKNIGIEVREILVDERIDAMRKKYNSEQDFIDAVVNTGATITDLRNKIRDQLKIKFIIDHMVRSKIYVNPQEVTDYYEKNKSDFGKAARINLESIFIPFGDDKEASLAKVGEVLTKIEERADFNDLIEQYSQAPSVGIIERGHLLAPIEETAFNLELNETSSAVEVENGTYIFKLIGKVPPEIAALEYVKDSIYDLLFKQKFKSQFMKWLEELKEDAYIEIKQ